ncbi:MAG: site-specific integrase [Desulfatiglans sp.]|nr:site-specific integrase [Desulfatiglans sp.]
MDVNVYKRDGSPFYWMKWYFSGKLHRQSTKTKNLKKANLIAKDKEQELLRHAGISGVAKIPFKEMMEQVLLDYKANGRKSFHIAELKVKILYAYFREDTKIVDITERNIQEYVSYRLTKCKNQKKEPIRPATVNRELQLLKRGFSILHQRKMIGAVPTIQLLREDNIRKGFFEHWEFLKLMEKASEHIKPLVTFMYFTGWRFSEVVNITWDMVDIDNGVITIPPGMTKNKKGRHYYMPDNILEMIRDIWSKRVERIRINESAPDYVFTNKNYTDRIKDIRSAWENSCKRAGLNGKLKHDFRRTAARNYVRAGVPQRVAQELLGHQTASIFSRYNIVSDQDLRDAVKKQMEYMNNQTKNRPIEIPPEGFREWEPMIKKMNENYEKEHQEGIKYLREKYENVVEVDKEGKVKVLQGEGFPNETDKNLHEK